MAFVNTPLQQLLKLPVMVMHYFEHKEKNNKISFLDYLELHYAKGPVHDKDYDRDMQLPFKKCSVPFTAVVVLSGKISFTPAIPLHFLPGRRSLYVSPTLVPSYLSRIWQPPKC